MAPFSVLPPFGFGLVWSGETNEHDHEGSGRPSERASWRNGDEMMMAAAPLKNVPCNTNRNIRRRLCTSQPLSCSREGHGLHLSMRVQRARSFTCPEWCSPFEITSTLKLEVSHAPYSFYIQTTRCSCNNSSRRDATNRFLWVTYLIHFTTDAYHRNSGGSRRSEAYVRQNASAPPEIGEATRDRRMGERR